MNTRKQLLGSVLVLLYAVTWVGGWLDHASRLRSDAEAAYRSCERTNRETAALARKPGRPLSTMHLHEGGPRTRVHWAVPLLPGVLLVDSEASVGGLGGRGGVTVVLYYGFGSTEQCLLWDWLS